MQPRNRIILVIAALMLAGLYVLPLWKISLEAPQYPEGIGMYIRINDVTGVEEYDLGNINNLNHYIGMKRIEPDSIPELRIMPWLIGFLVLLGLTTAAAGKRWLLYTWTLLFVAVATTGLVDFYLWEYDYGHNLDMETAIIKIPGMSYQPPLIGSKVLLNFVAHSWPAAGGWLALVALGTGVVLSWHEWRSNRRQKTASRTVTAGVAVAALVLIAGCTPEPAEIRYGEDSCVHCMMTVSDERYGTELVTGTGKTLTFDSIECLAAYTDANPKLDVHSLWVTAFDDPGKLIPLDSATFLRSENLRSPMGMNLTAFSPAMTPDAAINAFAGRVLTWEEVVELVTSDTPGTGHSGHPSTGME